MHSTNTINKFIDPNKPSQTETVWYRTTDITSLALEIKRRHRTKQRGFHERVLQYNLLLGAGVGVGVTGGRVMGPKKNRSHNSQ